MKAVPCTINFEPTAEQMAEAFWLMNNEKQADFYAHLYRISGGRLCLQTAYLVRELAKRHADGDDHATRGFRTLHSHAECYIEEFAREIGARPFVQGQPA